MRKRKKTVKLSLPADQRKVLFRMLLTGFLKKGRIRTTVARAKAIRPYVEKILTEAKKEIKDANQKVSHFRKLRSFVDTDELVKRILEFGLVIGNRNGGYTRIVKLPRRISDGTQMAFFELVDIEKLPKEEKPKEKTDKKEKKAEKKKAQVVNK